MKQHNFSAGPSILPQPVFQQAAAAVLDFDNMGLSILEISHRSPQFTAVMEESVSLVRELLGLDAQYEVMFLSGGASTQFFMTAMNLLHPGERAYYLDTGTWSNKAIKEATRFGDIQVLASSKDEQYTFIPKGVKVPADGRYLHITSNNTVYGTQYHAWPESPVPLVVDMSSDIFSRERDLSNVGMLYAGAQKNMGPAGTTLVVVRKDMLRDHGGDLPTMLNYHTHIAKQSMFNTPPVFPIYVSMLNMRWLREQGGVAAMGQRNAAKAELLYACIDRNPLYLGIVQQDDRSMMNPVFRLADESLTNAFLKRCDEAGIVGIKGHRSVGGFRASMYNAMELDSVRVLVEVMDSFANEQGYGSDAVRGVQEAYR
ncbi:MAG: 3-phosphoserine/phosphohydroxythreonine transaminase [Saprospiraceae bacterium]|nr:3-phosphoserine/phosphohydroxythreonine transaminase [Saprospiraceae bacterium]